MIYIYNQFRDDVTGKPRFKKIVSPQGLAYTLEQIGDKADVVSITYNEFDGYVIFLKDKEQKE